MSSAWKLLCTAGALAATTAAGIPSGGPPAVANAHATARAAQTRLEVWVGPQRIKKLKPGHSRTIKVTAVETMAVWDQVGAALTARTTAGKITPRKARTKKGQPAVFRLTRTPGSRFGFVTFTATSRRYGTAKRNISWGKVRLPRTLTGTLTYVEHDEWKQAGVPVSVSHTRERWHATFRLVSTSSLRWMGAALYRLSDGTWRAEAEARSGDEVCAGQGQGRAATASLRYDWRGTKTSSGAGLYWLDLTGSQSYRVSCTTHEYDSTPSFSLGFSPATNGVNPDHLKGARRVQHVGPNENADAYESWSWDLRAP